MSVPQPVVSLPPGAGEDAARVADDESLEVGWFAQDVLPPLNDYERLRIETTMRGSETAWFAPAGERLAALGFD